MDHIMLLVTVLLSCLPNLVPAQATSTTQTSSCPVPTDIQLRFPPTVRNNTPADWTPPPYAWIFGHWWVTHSSRLSYQALYNFQADTYPAFPTDNVTASERRNIDLTSFNLAATGNATADDHIYTVFGYDTPATTVGPAVYQFNGTGPVAAVSNSWEVLAWGYDRNGDGYRTEFETQVIPSGDPPCINIVSRAEMGPDNVTVSEIMTALGNMFNGSEIAVYAANITALHNDGRRSDLGPVACDQGCMNNTNLPPTS